MIHFSRCSPPPDFKHSSIWPSLRSAKNVKKQQEVSDLNQDYDHVFVMVATGLPDIYIR